MTGLKQLYSVVVPNIWAHAMYLAPLLPVPDQWARQFDGVAIDSFLQRNRPVRVRRAFVVNPSILGGLSRQGSGTFADRALAAQAMFAVRARRLEKPHFLLRAADRLFRELVGTPPTVLSGIPLSKLPSLDAVKERKKERKNPFILLQIMPLAERWEKR
jgi:hypothetical protein